MTLVERIKEVAKTKKGWNLKTTAERAGIGINSIYKWKTQTPQVDKLASVANVLGVSVDYLLGKTEDNASAGDKETPAKIVALHVDDDTTEEEREQIINFIEYLKNQRKNK